MNDDTDQVDALRRMLTAQANEIESLRSTQRVDWSHRIDPLAADAIRRAIRMLTPYTAAIPAYVDTSATIHGCVTQRRV